MSTFQTKYSHGLSVIHGENISVTTNASGDALWTFPTAFPTDVVTVHVTPCDTSIGAFVVKVHSKGSGFTTRTGVTIRVFDMAGAAIASFGVRVNVTAFGY